MDKQVDSNADKLDLYEEIADDIDSSAALEAAIESGDEIPAKFKGKSLKDVVNSYENLEKEFGRKNNEIGELRRLADQLLELQTDQKKGDARKPVSTDDLLERPDETLNSVIAEHPVIKDLSNKLLGQTIEKSKAAFEQRHPDWSEKMGSKEFSTWVQSNPTRLAMFQTAHKTYDYDTGSDLLDMFNDHMAKTVGADKATRDAATQKALKEATVETGAPKSTKKKIFKRTALMELMVKDPRKYAAMADEIHLAYKEGRVK